MCGVKKFGCFLFVSLCWAAGLAQETLPPDNPTPLLENIHLHLNKTAFFKGEHLWFKAYIQNQHNQLPAANTTNLHVGIFTKEGDVLREKMFLVNGGMCYGDFEIDSTFVADSYTLMAWTNYMKNFEEATPFLQKIQILGAVEVSEKPIKDEITIQVKPEGQYIVPNAFNNIGVTVFDGKGHPIKTDAIELITDEGVLVQSDIQTNALGQGRFGFFVDPAQSYVLRFKDANGIWITKRIESYLYKPWGIGIDNTAKDVILLKPKWQNTSSTSKKDNTFTLTVFTTNKVSFKQQYSFDAENTAISINRTEIPHGVHTAVLLNEAGEPLAHRMFFNHDYSNKRVFPVEVNYCLSEKQDSLQLDFILPKENTLANISFSVLPTQSNSNAPNNAISSSFLLQPYLKQQSVDGKYFFAGVNRSSDYQLDTHLLMEGVQKFSGNLQSDETQSISYERELYVPLQGKILDADTQKEKQVSIVSKSFGSMNLFDLATNKRFKGELPLFQGDSVLISVLNEKGKLRKPKAELYFDNAAKDNFDYSLWLQNLNPITIAPTVLEPEDELNLTDRTIALEEVVVSEKVKKSNQFQLTTEIQGRSIDKSTINRYRTFANYIRRLGFLIRPNTTFGGVGIFVVYPSVPGGVYPVVVTIEGMSVQPGELINMPLSSIKTMVYNRSVRPHIDPFIALTLRYDFDELQGREQYALLPVPNGYSRTQNYFSPNYPDYNSTVYQQYGAIWWENQLEIESDVPKSITVPLNGQQSVKVVVEGMSPDGLLYQTELVCDPFEDNLSRN